MFAITAIRFQYHLSVAIFIINSIPHFFVQSRITNIDPAYFSPFEIWNLDPITIRTKFCTKKSKETGRVMVEAKMTVRDGEGARVR